MDSNVGQQVGDFIAIYGLKVLGAILILIIGRMVAAWLRGLVKKMMTARGVDPALIGFVSSMVYAVIMIFVFLAALAKFGVQTASFVAILGAAGFAIGFALQGSLSNFASGVMLLLFRPFKVGDFVDAAGVAGTVKEIQLFTTIIATGDNVKILVPNGQIYGGTIKNFSANDTRRVDLVVGIGYDSDIEKAMEILLGLMKADSRIHDEPAPMVAVSELADSSVNFVVRAWVDKGDYWPVKFELTKVIKQEFDKNDIEIPFPQQVVHHVNPPAA